MLERYCDYFTTSDSDINYAVDHYV